LGVVEMPHTRCIVGHRVERAGKVIMEGYVTMESLVQGEHAKEVRRWLGSGGGTFACPEQRCEIVGLLAAKRALTEVKALGGDFMVDDTARQFEVGVGDGTFVIGSSKLGLDVRGKREAP
jgi:hypothetical protein